MYTYPQLAHRPTRQTLELLKEGKFNFLCKSNQTAAVLCFDFMTFIRKAEESLYWDHTLHFTAAGGVHYTFEAFALSEDGQLLSANPKQKKL